MTTIDLHTSFIEAAFLAMRDAEDALSAAKSNLDHETVLLTNAKNAAEKKLADTWIEIEKLMAESGEYEINLLKHHAKICYSSPRQSVKIVDIDAMPDEFCYIVRKPKLKEIGNMLKAGLQTNYASLEYGEKKLMWKAIKKVKESANG